MEFNSCEGGIEDTSCCDSDVETGHGCDGTRTRTCRGSTGDWCGSSPRLENCEDCRESSCCNCKGGCKNDSCRDSGVNGVGKVVVDGDCEAGSDVLRHPPCFVGRQFMHARLALAQAQGLHRALTPLQLQHGRRVFGFPELN